MKYIEALESKEGPIIFIEFSNIAPTSSFSLTLFLKPLGLKEPSPFQGGVFTVGNQWYETMSYWK